ncbi:toll/interleukin-1 receptor domain-containing protein [Zobellella sp. An-6]|uniref:toll/interleukin-1 receptor domain-containing protein n=1 Tax=Zobellella sp. An-6 TaxID=3400218 RepID=UPI0040432720
MAGINRAKPTPMFESYSFNKSASRGVDRPCIFLSHISVDKTSAIEIGNYIMNYADIDIYLDIYDEGLQQAAGAQDAKKITEFIESGITKSTHTMCLVSKDTVNSWWVPFELGYAKKSGKELSSLKLKGDVSLPEYLAIGSIIRGTRSLNEYIEKIVRDWKEDRSYSDNLEVALESHSKSGHPLDNYLDWSA